jgi:uncharacterized protein
MFDRMASNIHQLLMKYSVFILLLFSIVMVVSTLGVQFLASDFSHKIWFRTNDPYLAEYENFERKFGSNDSILLVVHDPTGIFKQKTIKTIYQITDQFWNLPDVMRVESITNYVWSYGVEGEVNIEPLFPDTPEEITPELVKNRSITVSQIDQIQNLFISQDMKTAVIYGLLKPVFGKKRDHHTLNIELNKLIKKHDHSGLEFHITGWGPVSHAFERATYSDITLVVPILLALIAIVLFFIFNSWVGVVLPLAMTFIGIGMATGIAGYLGVSFNIVTSMLPVIMLAVSMADSIHLLTSYRSMLSQSSNKWRALSLTLNKNLRPTILTTLSTGIGFFCLLSTDLVPISQLGIVAGIGVVIAWLLTIFFVLPILYLCPKRYFLTSSQKSKRPMYSSQGVTQYLFNMKGPIIFVFALMITLSVYYIGKVEINSSTFDYFSNSLPIKQASIFMEKNVGGVKNIQILINSDKVGGVKDPEFLHKVDQYERWIKSLSYVTKVSSVVSIIKELNQALNSNQEKFYSIPNNRELIAQELLLYSMGLPPGMNLNHWTTFDHREMRMDVRWITSGSSFALQAMEEIKAKGIAMGLNVKLTGKTSLVVGINDYIVTTFLKSMTIAIVLISLFMGLVFNSFRVGVISMIPNLLPLVMGYGLMGLCGINLDVGTVLITSVCLGITVDDTIFFLSNYSKHRSEQGATVFMGVQAVMSHTSSALIFTTLLLVVGFSSFGFGSLIPITYFGLMTAFILLMAVITDLLLLPAILFYIDSPISISDKAYVLKV